jgi:hypothetical protein
MFLIIHQQIHLFLQPNSVVPYKVFVKLHKIKFDQSHS